MNNNALFNRFRLNNSFNDMNVKNELLDYIYEKIDLYQYKYKLLETIHDLKHIQSDNLISPNYSGNNCLIVFTKLINKYYSFIVDRKTLSYARNQINPKNVTMIPINVRMNKDIYQGTIMDGILLNELKNKKQVFIINDMYYFRGRNYTQNNIIHKNINIKTYLKSNMISDNYMNTVELHVNNFYKLKDINDVINSHIKKLVYGNNIKGIMFYPLKSGMKSIFLFSTGTVKNVSVIKQYEKEKEKQIFSKNIFDSLEDNTTAVFEMRKTEKTDVYKLYLLVKNNKDGRKILSVKKIGLAYIPSKECTLLCKRLINDKNKVLVLCTYNKSKQKWSPIKDATGHKRPHCIDEVLK